MRMRNICKFTIAAITAAPILISAPVAWAQAVKIMARTVAEEVKAAHPEITGLEIAASRPGESCKTIAATEANEVGQKCDKDELTAMKTNRPFVEKERTEFDATLPLHDQSGKVIGTAGMDFKLEPGRTQATVTEAARKIVAELEKRLNSEN